MGGGQVTDTPAVWLAKRVTKAQRVCGNVVEGFASLKGSPREVRSLPCGLSAISQSRVHSVSPARVEGGGWPL